MILVYLAVAVVTAWAAGAAADTWLDVRNKWRWQKHYRAGRP